MNHRDDVQPNTCPLEQLGQRSVTSRPSGLSIVDSSDLLAGHTSLLIRHLGQVYRLQTTRQGKLILTK
jgi:hemin uptake protein HemP